MIMADPLPCARSLALLALLMISKFSILKANMLFFLASLHHLRRRRLAFWFIFVSVDAKMFLGGLKGSGLYLN